MTENDDLELLKKVIMKVESGKSPLPSALKKALNEYVSDKKENRFTRTRKKKLVGHKKQETRKNSQPQRKKTKKNKRILGNRTRKIKIKS
jgi:hypothetical protein